MPKMLGRTKLDVNISIDFNSCKGLNELSILTLKFMLGGLLRFKDTDSEKNNQIWVSGRKLSNRLHMPSMDARFLLEDSLKSLSEVVLYITVADNDKKEVVKTNLIESFMIEEVPYKSRHTKNIKTVYSANVVFPLIICNNIDKVIGLLFIQLDRIMAEIKP